MVLAVRIWRLKPPMLSINCPSRLDKHSSPETSPVDGVPAGMKTVFPAVPGNQLLCRCWYRLTILATTWSMVRPSVTSSMASTALRSGATRRVLS
jgi:hypothetical protein